MKAWIFVSAWVGLGIVVAARGQRSPGERVLAVVFWPFFLAAAPPATHPLARLRRALGTGAASTALIEDLERALGHLAARLARLEGALAELPPEGDPAAEASRRSRALLLEARDSLRREHVQALAVMEEAATRLVLAREAEERAHVSEALSALALRLRAEEEVGTAGLAGSGSRSVQRDPRTRRERAG